MVPMEKTVRNMIYGYHEYTLDTPARLTYAGDSLCALTGCTQEILTDPAHDAYRRLIHPADVTAYLDFLSALSRNEQTKTVDYRLLTGSGAILWVRDTMTSRKTSDGMKGVSVLCDITGLKAENENLRFLNDTIPCGFLRYTCEKLPKVTYLNDRMLDILRFPKAMDGEIDYRELYSENIYLMIPMEDRRKFSHFIEQVKLKEAPMAGEISVMRCDGTRGILYGWVTKVINKQGKEGFQSVCMDNTERSIARRAGETERYIKALSDGYDKIFEFDFVNRTVRFLYGRSTDVFSQLQNVPMHMEDAVRRWLDSTVAPADLDRTRAFFTAVISDAHRTDGAKPPEVRFRAKTGTDTPSALSCSGIFLKIDDNISFFCCRPDPKDEDSEQLRTENLSLKNMNEGIRDLVMRFTEGIIAFEVSGDGKTVKPMYVSDNVCAFFGYTPEEWIPMTRSYIPIETFVSRSTVGFSQFRTLLDTGEAEFRYTDTRRGAVRCIKAVCSEKHADGRSPRYVMLYNLDKKSADSTPAPAAAPSDISIRTFGYFDVFVGGKPIAFRNKKSKELLALLVDRRGGYITSEEAIGYLWEDEPSNAVTLARYRKVALRLKNILEEYGITEIVEAVDGKRRIVPELVNCDLYDYLAKRDGAEDLFKGSYLSNYSWAEVTLGELENN
ncbi:MAG: PAS domain-containing protein [Clostridia bacterium]|nr:PAS domain-containing protein [Clostridia bacterium]